MATLDEEFDALPDTPSTKSLNDEFDALPDAVAPVPAPAPRAKTGILSTIGRSAAEAVPFAPQVLGISERELLEAREDRPFVSAGTRLGTTLGEYGLAGRVAGRVGIGGLAALQEASALQREGNLDFADPMTYAKLAGAGVLGAAAPALFKGAGRLAGALTPAPAAPAIEAGVRRIGQAAIRTAPAAALAVPQAQTYLSPETDTSGKAEAAANLLLLGSVPVLEGRRGLARVGAERAASIAEQAEAEAKKVIGEKEAVRGEEAVAKQLGREAEQIVAQRREANRRAKRELEFEQSIDVASDKLKGGAQKAVATLQGELGTQQQLIQALENATDPSLLGWRAKQFQDMANRLNSYEASWTRQYPGIPLPPVFNEIRAKLDDSLMRNTQLMSQGPAREAFLADPDAKFAEYQARKVAEGRTQEANILQRLNAALQDANKDFSAEARAQAAARKPPLSDARRASIYAKHGLIDPGATPPFGSPPVAELASEVSRGVVGAPMKQSELAELYRTAGLPSGMTEADILQAANVTPAEAARLLAEQRAAARANVEFGTQTPTPLTQRQLDLSSTGRALYETAFPEAIRPDILLRGAFGRLRGTNVVPRTLPEYTARTSPTMSTEARMQTPFEALEIASAFQNLLQRDVAVDSLYRKFVERTPGATWLSFLRANPVVAAKVEAERQAAAEAVP